MFPAVTHDRDDPDPECARCLVLPPQGASGAGLQKSSSDYPLSEIRDVAEKPTMTQLRARLQRRTGLTPSIAPRRRFAPSADDRPRRLGRARGAAADAECGSRRAAPVASATDAACAASARCRNRPGRPPLRRDRRDRPGAWPRGSRRPVGFPLRRYPHDILLPRIWDLRYNLMAYDAAYVALAEALDAPLFTRDRRLAAATAHHAWVELV